MTLVRRQFLRLALGAAALPAVSGPTLAQDYPARPVRIVVGFPAGGPVDIAARLVGQWLSERLGQPVVIDNRPGAGGNIGTEAVVKAAPDGYTLLMCGPVNTINTTLYEKLNFNFARDITPVAGAYRVPLALVVNPAVPANTVADLIAYAKANPGKIALASAGNGTPQHVSGELFKMMTGVDMLHVPYRGSAPALTDLIGGQVQVMIDAMPSAIEHIKSGKLRALAVTTATRSEALPDVPALGDVLPGYESSSWYGIAAPRSTPAGIVDRLSKEVNTGLAQPAVKARLIGLGAMSLAGSPADFEKLIADETEKWAKVIRAANIKMD